MSFVFGFCDVPVLTNNFMYHVTGHHHICLAILYTHLVERLNRTLQHVAIDVLEIDTFNPTFCGGLGDESEIGLLRRGIYIQLFVNRFTHHMKDERDDLGL